MVVRVIGGNLNGNCNRTSKMILVVGSQRTGSTLMSMILGSHPFLTFKGDPDLPDILDGTYHSGDVLHAVAWTARHKILKEHVPQVRYIFMLRNIYAVVSSMVSLGSSISWSEQFAVPETARAISGISSWHSRHCVIPYLGDMYRSNDLLKLSTVCAYLKSYMLREYVRSEMDVYAVRYEELVNNPKGILAKVMDFLGLEWDDTLLNHHNIQTGKPFAGNDPNRSIDTESIDKWRSRLSDSDVEKISATVEELDSIFYGFANNHRLCQNV